VSGGNGLQSARFKKIGKERTTPDVGWLTPMSALSLLAWLRFLQNEPNPSMPLQLVGGQNLISLLAVSFYDDDRAVAGSKSGSEQFRDAACGQL
jgi:hypothetical protein